MATRALESRSCYPLDEPDPPDPCDPCDSAGESRDDGVDAPCVCASSWRVDSLRASSASILL